MDPVLRDAQSACGLPFSVIDGVPRRWDATVWGDSWQLQVHDVPKKSRVETQVKLRLDLLDVSGSPASSSSDAEGGSKPVTQWSFIRVPQTASVKTRSKGVCNPDPTSVLTLHASMFCATNPTFTNTPVPCCQACRTRENKRNAKKTTTSVKHSKSTANSKNVTPAGSTNATPATSDAEMYTGSSGVHRSSYPSQSDIPKDDYDSPIDFTCHEMLDFSSGSTPLSFRIVCYCRHYKERTGFCVLLTLRDNFNRVVGEVKTPPIMIMDDHKSVQKMTPAHTADEEEADNYGFSTKRRTKRIVSKYSEGESRIKEEDADEFEEKGVGAIRTKARISRHSTVSRSGTGLSKLTTSTAAGPPIATTTNIYNGSGHAHRNSQSYTHSESPLPTTAPSSPSAGFSPPPTQSNGESGHKMDPEGPSFTTSLFSPTSTSPAMLGTVPIASMPPVHMPLSGIPSLGASTQVPILPILQPNPHPHITRAIPTAGPMTGGIEVTLLGSNFSRDALANAYILFGNNAVVFGGNGGAQVYSESAIICTLPPSAVAGPVEVKLLGVPRPEPNSLVLDPPTTIFTYTDEGDRDLMMQALQILGWQNSGQWQDPRSVAANILGGASTGMMGIESTNASDMSSLFGNGFQTVRHAPAQFKQQRQGKSNGPADVEDLVLKVLRSAQNPVTGTIKHISAAHPGTGQTLLHLASALGFAKLVNALIGWSADVDIADKNGFSPVHFACFYGRVECVDTLVRQGRAHLEGRDLQDRTPFDVCGTEDVKDLVLELEEEVETRRRRSTVNSEIESGGEGDDEEDEEEYEPSISEVDPMQSLSRHISRVNSVASIASSRKISRAATPFSLGDIVPPLHALPSRAPISIHSPPSATESPVAARPGVNSWSLPPMPWPVQFPTGWQLPNVPAMPQFGRRRVHPHSGEGQRKRHDEKAQESEKMMFMWMEYVKNMWIQQQQQGSTTQMENDPPP
ncbi:SPT3 Dosage dependent suppressor of Ty-induced promoter mutations-like protein, partial [Serendipita sp. 399]